MTVKINKCLWVISGTPGQNDYKICKKIIPPQKKFCRVHENENRLKKPKKINLDRYRDGRGKL